MTRSRSATLLAAAAALPLFALVAGCGGSEDDRPSATVTTPKTASGRTATLGVTSSVLGKILVDSKGRTLYLFKKDSGGTSACSGPCASAWPPLLAKGRPTVGRGASASLVATTTRSDGGQQVTFNRHPLYRYRGDEKPGDTNGQGLTTFGAGWYALSPQGNQVSGTAPSAGGGSTYGGGGGY